MYKIQGHCEIENKMHCFQILRWTVVNMIAEQKSYLLEISAIIEVATNTQ